MVDDRHDEEGEYQTAYQRLHQDETNEELALNDDDSLPWLESSDYVEGQGTDTSRMVGFALLALIALVVILGAIWYFSRPSSDGELAGDGSAISAPEDGYKQRPEDAGGKEFANTGDVAPAVGQGQTREGRIADAKPSPTPTPTASTSAKPATDEPEVKPSPATSSGGVGVQVGAFSTKALAERGWQTLNGQTEKLQGVSHRVLEGTVDNGTVYRLQAITGSREAADTLCRALKADGVACQVK
ncbi:SPOR domain-containing protein [Erythrobacter sp. 3-20A1M]|uniref:SPOR domain-containing protein n=1 Tax=Erythrobacter sp. 3-20A1M TaxID=2653850 RepID=UPI00203B8924|nr:SPOR domain-containing protein [Erythrobacter sp. 3-20A1M]